MAQIVDSNPRLAILRRDVEQTILKPFRSHGWSAEITREHDRHSSIELTASKGDRRLSIAVLYGSATDNSHYVDLSQRVEHIFFNGSPYMLETFARGISIPVEAISDFFPLLVRLNKEVEPDRSPNVRRTRTQQVLRIADENPLEGVLSRLEHFTSVRIASNLILKRADYEEVALTQAQISNKAEGVAFSLRNALDYITFSPSDKLIKRIVGLYYGTISFAFAEMLASPTGPADLDEVEGMTKQGHGLYTITGPNGGFADLRVGLLSSGFMPQWLSFLGRDISEFPKKKPKNFSDLDTVPENMVCSLEHLLSSMPEIDDLFAAVFGSAPGWITPSYDSASNQPQSFSGVSKKCDSTYALLVDSSGLVPMDRLAKAGWPMAEVQLIEKTKGVGNHFRARIDHAGQESWWDAIPTHTSPFNRKTTILLPTVGNLREYRTIAVMTLYALSILVRYMPSAWRRIEGGDEDQYLALIKASLNVWGRVLPQQFLQSITDERVYASQPGGLG